MERININLPEEVVSKLPINLNYLTDLELLVKKETGEEQSFAVGAYQAQLTNDPFYKLISKIYKR